MESKAQASSIMSKESSSQATTSQGGSMSGKAAANSSSYTTGQPARLFYINEKKNTRQEIPKATKQPKGI